MSKTYKSRAEIKTHTINRGAIIFLILAISIATHFAFFGYPREVVFDEVHFGKFVSAYLTHQYFFDIHPPLGKLLISGIAKVVDFQPGFTFKNIGDAFPNGSFIALRVLSTLAGALIPLVIFLIAEALGMSSWGAFLSAYFVSLENALIVHSRFILVDSFLLLFGFTSLLFYLWYRNDGKLRYAIVASLCAAFAISIKWTGLSFLGLIGIFELVKFFSKENRGRRLSALGRMFLLWAAVPFAIYFLVFAIHFQLLYRSGEGDTWMTPEFQKTLAGNTYEKDSELATPNVFSKFLELNVLMLRLNNTVGPHPYSSVWYEWPVLKRPIYYWNKDSTDRIYLLGNPVLWWLSTIAALVLLVRVCVHPIKSGFSRRFFFTGYLVNIIPFLAISRPMFLYHYFVALIFAILVFAHFLGQQKNRVFGIYCAIVITASFVYFSPLTYGTSLSPKEYEQRVWLSSWK